MAGEASNATNEPADGAPAGAGVAAGKGDEWTPVLHPGLKRLYYYHKRSGRSVWTRPDGADCANGADKEEKQSGALRTAEGPDDGWEAHYHEHWKRPYYFNRHSRKSTWTDPETAALLKGLDAAPPAQRQPLQQQKQEQYQQEQTQQQQQQQPLQEQAILQQPVQQPVHRPLQQPLQQQQGACDVLEAGNDEGANNEAAIKARLQFPELGEVRVTQLSGPLAALNGMKGTVVFVSKSGRVGVRLAGKVLLLRAANLELVAFNPFATPRHARLGSSGSVVSSMVEVSVHELSLDDPDAGPRSDAAAAPPSIAPLQPAC
jgi:hypothetical protein